MFENPYESSLESRILSATPVELVLTLYDAALLAVREARQHLARHEIAERSREVAKAVEILTELSASLDHHAGGDLSRTLASLYDYMQRRLLDANFRQADDGLEETERLLATVREAWAQAAENVQPSEAEAEPAAPRIAELDLDVPPMAELAAMPAAYESFVQRVWSA